MIGASIADTIIQIEKGSAPTFVSIKVFADIAIAIVVTVRLKKYINTAKPDLSQPHNVRHQ